MIAARSPLGMADQLPPSPIDASTPIEAILDLVAEVEPNLDTLPLSQLGSIEPVEGVTSSTEVIHGVDGNDITPYIRRPLDTQTAMPAVLHLHGGGMFFLEAAGPGVRPMARRAGRHRPRRRRCRGPQRCRQARSAQVPGRSQRLLLSARVAGHASR